jgi:hypothetical protein
VADAIDEQVDGPGLTCTHADYGGGDTSWVLSYLEDAEGALIVTLTVPISDQPFIFVRKGDLSFAADGTGGSQLTATVNDRQSEVDFAAEGKDFDGAAINLSAVCSNITRV